jgi:hypothetical protein
MSRISYRNYPVLEYLKKGHFKQIPCFKEEMNYIKENKVFINDCFNDNYKGFNSSVHVISHSFLNAISEVEDKLGLMLNNDTESISEKGTFIFPNNVVYLYNIFFDPVNKKMEVIIWKTNSVGGFIYITSFDQDNYNKILKSDYIYNDNIHKSIKLDYQVLRLVIMFKKYAKVEIIESKAKSKTNQFGCKYMNETDLDIQYLDSKWFTTLVNSNSFKVRGFFRLQPKKKDGEWTKELIWIDEFEKKGYNRQAGILTNNNK